MLLYFSRIFSFPKTRRLAHSGDLLAALAIKDDQEMRLIDNETCGYRFLTGIPPYSSGVVAMPGFEIVRASFPQPVPLEAAFKRVADHLEAEGVKKQALCAMELRSPEAFSFTGFDSFNAGYIDTLRRWEILLEDENPVARTNVAPIIGGPSEPGVYAFCYVVASQIEEPTFVVAGAGEVVRQSLDSHRIIREGETTADAMAEKAAHVLSVMEQRLHGLERNWGDVRHIDVYTAQVLDPYLQSVLLENIGLAAIHGINWHFSNPPITGLEFEMDMRGLRREVGLPGD
jgi:hypothetical protein